MMGCFVAGRYKSGFEKMLESFIEVFEEEPEEEPKKEQKRAAELAESIKQKNYFIYINGRYSGPFTQEDFKIKVKMNEVDQYTLVLKNGMPQVAAMGGIPELKALLSKNERRVAAGLRHDVLERDGFRCQHCGRSAREVALEVDHINPVSNGGKSTMDNLITLCIDCNRGKSNKV
jgi:hypothetical protein